jgi:hypothetical protein
MNGPLVHRTDARERGEARRFARILPVDGLGTLRECDKGTISAGRFEFDKPIAPRSRSTVFAIRYNDACFIRGLVTALACVLLGCSSGAIGGSPAPSCTEATIDRFKELTVVDDAVVGDARAMNRSDGPWSFRHAVESMVPNGSDPSSFVQAWFNEWVTDSSINGYPIPDGPIAITGATQGQFAQGMKASVLCPWMKASPSNGCNADCSACTAEPPKVDLAQAPFRLLAIVNRLDLAGQPGVNPLGEARLVFGVTNGPADESSSPPLQMTLIFEYGLPPSFTISQWADTWHHLGSYTSFDESYRAALQKVTDRFVSRDAIPDQPNGSALSQARTNGNAIFWTWQMRQFAIGIDGQMHAHTLRNTPDPSLNGSAVLAQYIQTNAEAIESGSYLLPETFLSGSADELLYTWNFPGLDPKATMAFANGTCNGCHLLAQNASNSLPFQVSPILSGVAKLSTFVNNPADPSHDDLARRTVLLQSALCGQ